MSTPFDPTKFNLNPEEPLASPKEEVPHIIKEKEKIQTPQKINHKNESDPLGETKQEDIIDQLIEIEEKEEVPQVKTDVKVEPLQTEDKKLIDINLASLEDLITRIHEKQYDFVIIEPEDVQVKVTFRQDNIDREIKYVKFPIYSNILFKVKQIAKLVIEDTTDQQEGKGKVKIGIKTFQISVKTAPGQNGEKIWCKAKEDTSENTKKQAKKTSLSMILGFLGAILLVGLILGGAFIAFIVLNAKTVEDVRFFANLGINLNDINTFISQIVTLIFSILLSLFTISLSIFLFKFFLTKKSLKRKKISYGIISGILLIFTFTTGSAWMIIDQKIRDLPNWQEQAYGDLKIFDNALLVSEDFTINQALLSETENLIGPITLKFDLENFQNNQAKKGITIKKYVWDFGGETIETFTPSITKTFSQKGNYEISIIAHGEDQQGESFEQALSNIPAISISHVIEIQETLTNNGGKKLSFDASNLEELGKIQWYLFEPVTETNKTPFYKEWTQEAEGYEFIPGRIFFDELFVGISIVSGTTVDSTIDKIIVIRPDGQAEISGNISYKQDIEEELQFEFFIEKPSTGFANGFIEGYEWLIEDKSYKLGGDLSQNDISPGVKHVFKSYGDQTIKVILTDSTGKSETLTKTISIQKRIELRDHLLVFDSDEKEFEELRYEEKTNEYYIDGLGVPAKLKFDARYVRPTNIVYSLQDATWDIGNNGNIDARGKSYTFDIPTEGNHILVVEYTFVHRKNPNDTIILKQYIYIEGVKKEAILDLIIEKTTNYAPVTVRFDASKSFIKNDDIIKFIYDYGDGISEERDSINPGHRYSKSGDYTVKLTVVGNTGKTYSMEKKLILLPPPQTVKISTSLKKAPIGQGIDFSSAESEGQIIEYFWDFGDGNVSTEANPTHSYSKVGNFTVKLKVDFANKNSINDEMEIEIFQG